MQPLKASSDGAVFMLLLSSADVSQNQLSGTSSEGQTVWFQVRVEIKQKSNKSRRVINSEWISM